MKRNWKSVVVVVFAAWGLSSCEVYDYPMYTSASFGVSSGGVSTSVSWTDAQYDVNGFPIFGYSYGQPVYGYTAGGSAVFSFYALTSSCCVPCWGPAHWYCGHWHYPKHIHRVSVPPRHPSGHYPGRRPGGHHKSAAPYRPAVNPRPVHGVVNPPGVHGKPVVSPGPGHSALQRPGIQGKPEIANRPSHGNRPQMQRPRVHQPRPQRNRVQTSRPQVRPQAMPRPVSRSQSVSRPMPRPGGGGGRNFSGGGYRGGGHAQRR